MFSKNLWVFLISSLLTSFAMHGASLLTPIDSEQPKAGNPATEAIAQSSFEDDPLEYVDILGDDASERQRKSEKESKRDADIKHHAATRAQEATGMEFIEVAAEDVRKSGYSLEGGAPLTTPIFGEQSAVPKPVTYTDKIDDKLKKSVLDHCPQRVKQIRDIWKLRATQYKTNKDITIFSKKTPKKLLLVGPSGTGKSTIGKAIAADCNISHFTCVAPLIANEYVTSGAHNLRKIFAQAEALKEPCVIVIDEIETLLHQHKNKQNAHVDMLTVLWTLLDEHKKNPILFIATANSIKDAPTPIETRLGKYKVTIPLPTKDQRECIISYYMKALGTANDFAKDVTAQELAKKTHNFPHRHLEDLIECALEKVDDKGASVQVTMKDCMDIINTIKSTDSQLHISYKGLLIKVIKFTREWILPVGSSIVLPITLYVLSQRNGKKLHDDQMTLSKEHHAENMGAQLHASAVQKYQHKPDILQETAAALEQRRQALIWYRKETKATIDGIKSELLSSSTT